MVEATLLELTGKCNMHPIEYAIMRFKEWYKGDSWYGDGINLHMDYYNSFVIHQCSWIFWKSCRNITKAKPTFIKRTATFLQICRTTRKNDFSGWSIPCNRPFYSIPFWNVPCTFNSSSKRFATNYHYQVTSPMRPNCCYKRHMAIREFRRTWMADFRVCRTSTTNSWKIHFYRQPVFMLYCIHSIRASGHRWILECPLWGMDRKKYGQVIPM